MNLDNWFSQGLLVKHESSPEEMRGLFSVIDRSILDSKAIGLSPDGKFAFAYNAALQCAMAALAAEGYRPGRGSHHHHAIESLKLTLGESEKKVRLLDAARKKRAVSIYELSGAVSDAEVNEMFAFAEDLKSKLYRWLKKNHPNLTP